MESRPKLNTKKERTNSYTTLKKYTMKREKKGGVPAVHIPFSIKPKNLNQENSKFLFKVIQK